MPRSNEDAGSSGLFSGALLGAAVTGAGVAGWKYRKNLAGYGRSMGAKVGLGRKTLPNTIFDSPGRMEPRL